MLDIITKKKNKEVLTHEELYYAFNGYLNKEIPDYQMTSLLMAIVINGLTFEELKYLLIAGKHLNLIKKFAINIQLEV